MSARLLAASVIWVLLTPPLVYAAELISQAQNAPLPNLQPNGSVAFHALSGDGRYVVYTSDATNLSPGESQASFGLYRHDTRSDQFELLLGHANAAITSVRYVINDTAMLLQSTASNLADSASTDAPNTESVLYLYWPATGEVAAFDPQGVLADQSAVISADGRSAAFGSEISAGNYGITLFDRTSSQLRLVLQNSNRPLSPSFFSDDGRFLLFTTGANNLNLADTDDDLDTYLLDTSDLSVVLLGGEIDESVYVEWSNSDASKILLKTTSINHTRDDPTITPWQWMLFNRSTGSLERVSVPGLPSSFEEAFSHDFPRFIDMSEDARYMSFRASTLMRDTGGLGGVYYVWDRITKEARNVIEGFEGQTRDVSPDFPANLSDDGRYVVFQTDADGVVEQSVDGLFLHDTQTSINSWVAKRNGSPVAFGGDRHSHSPLISANGDIVAFGSQSTNLVPDMQNFYPSVIGTEWGGSSHRLEYTYVRDRSNATTSAVSGNLDEANFPFGVRPGFLSGGGRYLTLLPGRFNRTLHEDLRGFFDASTGTFEQIPEAHITLRQPFDAEDRLFVFSTFSADFQDADTAYSRIVVKNLLTGDYQHITAGANGHSFEPSMDPSGRYVLFQSDATNIDSASAAQPSFWYIHDLVDGTSEVLMPLNPHRPRSSSQSISLLDGNPNLVLYSTIDSEQRSHCRIFDRTTRIDQSLIENWTTDCSRPAASYDGNRIAFVAPSNALTSETPDRSSAQFIYDRTLERVEKVPDSGIGFSWPALSGDGKTIAFTSSSEDIGLPGDGNDRADVFAISVDGLFRENNRAPLAISQDLSTPQDEALVVVLTGRDDDADPVSYRILTAPANGSLSGELPRLVYTPNVGFEGEDELVFALEDGLLQSEPASVRISVGEIAPAECVADCLPPLAAVLPSSRSVLIDTTATVFATVINPSATETAIGCTIQLNTGLDIGFEYRSADPATNLVVGTANPTVDIAPGGFAPFVLALTPGEVFAPTELSFEFVCENTGTAPVAAGLNTLLLASTAEPAADVVSIALTPSANGIATAGREGYGVYVVATANLGAAAEITATTVTDSWFSGETLICETNTATGACLSDPSVSVQTTMNALGTHSFALFVRSDAPIALDPANYRQVVQFVDGSGTVRGSTSVALWTGD